MDEVVVPHSPLAEVVVPNTTGAEGEEPTITSTDTSCLFEPCLEPTTTHIEEDQKISAVKRKLDDCSLPVAKRRDGRPRIKKALDHRKFFPKTFSEKALEEQAKRNYIKKYFKKKRCDCYLICSDPDMGSRRGKC